MAQPRPEQREAPISDGLLSARSTRRAPGDLLHKSETEPSGEPARQTRRMTALSQLSVLQAACLAIGLASLPGITSSGQIGTSLQTILWITLAQGSIGYLVLNRLFRAHQTQRNRLTERLRSQHIALSRTRDAVVLGLTRMAESRDDETDGHLERVGFLASRLAEAARNIPAFQKTITPQFVRLIRFSATLHDIGKVGIKDAILHKPGSLTDDERRQMQRHTRISSSCLQEIETCLGDANFLQMAHEVALFHHERWDGTGYPTGLAGEEIPLAARIVSVVDVYDALAAKRPYKEPYDHERCVAIITAGKGSQFDPRLIEVFLTIQDEFRLLTKASQIADRTAATLRHREDSGSRQPMPTRELERMLADVDVSLGYARQELQAESTS